MCDVGERAKKKTDVNGPTAGAETRSGDLRGAPNSTHSFASQITVLRSAVTKTLLSHTAVVWSAAAVRFACKSLSWSGSRLAGTRCQATVRKQNKTTRREEKTKQK